MLRQVPFPVFQAPFFPAPPGVSRFVARGYSDVLAAHGFADADLLRSMVGAWDALIDAIQPALIVADHSPTLCLAARGAAPLVLVSNSFALPPDHLAAFPVLLPSQAAIATDERLLDVINQVQAQRRRPSVETLPAMLTGAGRFVRVLPELDIYREQRNTAAVGPLEPLPAPMPAPKEAGFFAYLSGEAPTCEQIGAALISSGWRGRAYIRSAAPEVRARLKSRGLNLLDRPAPIEEVLADSTVIIHHGGSLAQAALSAGRPQFVFPMHVEQLMTARALQRMGVAHCLVGRHPDSQIIAGINDLMKNPTIVARALAAADSVQSRGPWDSLPAIIKCCEAAVPILGEIF
jgi:hypothetical protein